MSKVFQIFLLLVFSGSANSTDIYCNDRKSLESVDMLDAAYENAKIVFLANVEIEILNKAPHLRWRYSAISPILKGQIESEGYFYPSAEVCEAPDLSERAVFLVFLEGRGETLTSQNTLMVVYNRGKAHEGWALEWAASKAHNKARQ